MKLNFRMPEVIKSYYEKEIEGYKNATQSEEAWFHLERAHIIGQALSLGTHRFSLENAGVGSERKKFVRNRRTNYSTSSRRAIFIINQIPIGNIGRSTVSMVKPQPIPEDIKKTV